MPAEEKIPHQPAGQPDIPRGQTAAAIRCGVLFPQAGIEAENSVRRQIFRQFRIQRMKAFDDDNPIPAVNGLHPVGLLDFEIEDRRLTRDLV